MAPEDETNISGSDRFWYHPALSLVAVTYFAFSIYWYGFTTTRGIVLGMTVCAFAIAVFDYFTNHGFLRWVHRLGK